ncbi:MAG: DUF3307 domain-containing protein [Rhodobacteraceae bacterium]|nr:DUF3307 domain-containing protein [Paracoccaceae bacterium]
MRETFVLLLLAHVLADFLMQSGAMVRNKHRPAVLLAHTAIVLVCAVALTGNANPVLLLLAAAHAAIDAVKTGFRLAGLRWFLADQAAHLVTLVLAAAIAPDLWSTGLWPAVLPPDLVAAIPWVALHLAGLVLATRTGGFVVGALLAPYLVSSPDLADGGLPGAGQAIGLLERGLTYLLVVIGQPTGVTFLIAAKSVLRFNTVSGDRKASEYVIIGTLASIGWAMLTALAILALAGPADPVP